MKDDQLTPEERRKYVDLALSHCRRLGSLVSDLFELAKLESKDALIHAEPFSLGELVQDVVQKFHLRSEEKKIRIFTNIGIGIPFVHADIALIERVLENLIENALRHTPEGGTVSIVLAPDGDGVTVNVSDTGSGIPEEEIPRIFDRFYRIGKSGRDKTEGSGLGLAIAKQILDLHGSPIHVRSVPNHGTTFTFTLPFEERLPLR
jgi:two-component system OmpR family sensor kinase